MTIDDPRIPFLLDSVEDWIKRFENASAQNAEAAERMERIAMDYSGAASRFEDAARKMHSAANDMSGAASTMYSAAGRMH